MSRRADRAAPHAATAGYRIGLAILLAGGSTVAAGTARAAPPVDDIVANGYHFQQAPFYCGPGSMEMMLDTPDITTAGPDFNATVTNALNFAAATNTPHIVFENGIPTGVLGTPTTGDLGLQNSLYSGVWGARAGLAFASNAGTPPAAFANVMNAVDSAPNGNHNYANWNFAPGVATNGVLASRTVADAITQFQVPATVAVENGAHWIDVHGVSTDVGVVRNAPYQINGFIIRDPWTGFAVANPGYAAIGGYGLGFNTYLRYGWDNLAGGGVRLAPWFQVFNPTGPRGQPPNSYSIVVEPLGPEFPDTLADAPTGLTQLGSAIDLTTAIADAGNDLAADPTLLADVESASGGFDTSAVDDISITLPGDSGGQGDWLIPYDGSGGTDDVLGVVLIDKMTGAIDEATWFDGSDGVSNMTLAQIDTLVQDEFNPATQPNDNLILDLPEPASALLLLPGLAGLLRWRLRRRG